MTNQIKEIAAYIDAHAAYYEDLADRIWEHAELSLKEYASTALYCEKLKELGFTVTEKLCGIDTAFCGSYGSGKPVIGILGEYDALSGLSQKAGACTHDPLVPGASGHGCGHNLLGAGSLAAAAAVRDWLEKTRVFGKSWTRRSAGTPATPIRSRPAPTPRASRSSTSFPAYPHMPRGTLSTAAAHWTRWSL